MPVMPSPSTASPLRASGFAATISTRRSAMIMLYPTISRSVVGHPIASKKEPEGEAGVPPVAFEAALDHAVADRALPAKQPGIRRPGPGIEDQPVVAREHQHDVCGGVRPDAGQCLKLCSHPVVRQIAPPRGRH